VLLEELVRSGRNVRGILFVDYVRTLRRYVPDWRRALPPDVAAVVGAQVNVDAWYPMEVFERLGLAILEYVVRDQVDVIRLWGRETLKVVLSFFPELNAPGDPRESLMRFQNFFLSLFDFQTVSLEDLNDQEAHFRIGWGMSPRAEEAATWQAVGFFEEMVTASGGRNVRTKLHSRAWLEREPPTTFSLHWEPQAPEEPVDRTPRVLVVDDEVLVGRALTRVLAKVADVTHAIDAIEALRELEAHDFDVVVADFAMPGRNGLDLLEEVAHRWPRVRRVLHSGAMPNFDAADALLGGIVHELIDKPAPQDVMVRAVTTPVR
jgi:CheY-like chemotaxis protein